MVEKDAWKEDVRKTIEACKMFSTIHPLCQSTGMDQKQAVRVTGEVCEQIIGINPIKEVGLDYKAYDFVSVAKLAELLNVSVRVVNIRMRIAGFLYKDDKGLEVTPEGWKYCSMSSNGRVKWVESIVVHLQGKVCK
jgi:hypothetical protein